MQADFSVELGGDAPALEIPWRSNDPCVRYYDLKKHPELVQKIPEAAAYPELGSFLSRMNAAGFPLATAKCDVWSSSEVAPEEEIFGDRKFVSYVDLIFVDERDRCSFAQHAAFAKELCRLLAQAPGIAAAVELVIRHCYYHQQRAVSENEAEQDGTLSKNVKDYGTISCGNAETMGHGGADVARCGEGTDTALQEEPARAANSGVHVPVIQDRDEPANVSDYVEHMRAIHQIKQSNVTNQDEQAIVPNLNESAALGKSRQLNAQETERSDLLQRDASFKTEPLGMRQPSSVTQPSEKTEPSGKTEPSRNIEPEGKIEPSGKKEPSRASRIAPLGESSNVQLEPKLHREGPNSSVTGFCLTAYVAGFGDCDHDPLRRWKIGLNLLQHAIVQLNSELQPKV